MKEKVNQALRVVIVAVLLIAVLALLTEVTRSKRSDEKYMDFYRAEYDHDVVYIGTSHIQNGVFPVQMWNEYGIVSYDFGYSSCRVPESYWVLRNLLEYTNPEVVIFDIYRITDNSMYRRDKTEQRHVQYDTMPLSLVKIQAVFDEFADYEHKLDFIWPFIMYHSRWDSLKLEDLRAVSKCENGACAMFGVDTSQLEASDVIGTQQTAAFDSVGLEYAKRISQLCKERGIKLILTLLPYAQCSEQAQMEYNYAASVLADEHVEYLNLLDMEGLDYATDFYNADHLNLAGGGKVTAYLAEHLRENYGIKDRREEAACAQMDETLAGYTAIRAGELRRETDLNNYLLRLHDTCFVFEAAGETAGGLNEVQMRLLEGAKERRIANAGQENAGEGGMMICTYDAVTREMVETVYVRDGVICR